MTIADKIRVALAYKRMSEAELARALGSTPSAFNQRMKTEKFSSTELDRIAKAMGSEFIFSFELPDGTKV